MVKKTSETIILAWIGNTDVSACKPNKSEDAPFPSSDNLAPDKIYGNNGPIRTLTDKLPAARVILLASAAMESLAEAVRCFVQRGTAAEIEVYQTDVQDPTDYTAVHNALARFFAEYDGGRLKGAQLAFNITPGTPAMQAVSLYFSQARLPRCTAYVVTNPHHVRPGQPQYHEVTLPFKLSSQLWDEQPTSPCADETFDEALQLFAPIDEVSILLLGEPGVGKSHFAEQIHTASGRKGRFLAVNCGCFGTDVTMLRSELFGHTKNAFTGANEKREGAFVEANKGTLFLDEIGDLPMAVQAALLTALERKTITPLGATNEIKVDVRIITATNRNLVREVQEGNFREDLYYRIAMYPIHMPPLREIAANDEKKFNNIVDAALKNASQKLHRELCVDDEARAWLATYSWPGNIRELYHVLLLAGISANTQGGGVITSDVLQRHLTTPRPKRHTSQENASLSLLSLAKVVGEQTILPRHLDIWLAELQDSIIAEAMRRTGNMARAAELLGMSYQNLRYYWKKRE